jgi:ribonuclease HI
VKIETAGIVSKKSGSKFAAIVRYEEKRADYVHGVSGDYTMNQVELLAVKFAILGAKPPLSVGTMTISTPNQYVADMLEQGDDGKWIKTAKSNKELVEEIRGLLQSREIEIVYERNEEARELCRAK